ncbi:hypothetical protein HaLaN_24853, partial [Haematococcus lacustris]
MFEPGAVTKYVPKGPLGPFFWVSPNQHITNRAYQYGTLQEQPSTCGGQQIWMHVLASYAKRTKKQHPVLTWDSPTVKELHAADQRRCQKVNCGANGGGDQLLTHHHHHCHVIAAFASQRQSACQHCILPPCPYGGSPAATKLIQQGTTCRPV